MNTLKGCFAGVVLAVTLMAQAEVPAFQKGDRVTFIGDSITHGGRYHSNAYLEALPQEGVLRMQEEELLEKIWTVNQPRPHRWTIVPTIPGKK